MDYLDRSERLFRQVDTEISGLLKIVHHLHEDPRKYRSDAIEKMEKVLAGAGEIGGTLLNEAKTLRTDLYAFLEKPSEEVWMKIQQSTLHIKQEMREI